LTDVVAAVNNFTMKNVQELPGVCHASCFSVSICRCEISIHRLLKQS